MKRTALITGGIRGIGAAIAKELKANHYKVIVSYYRNQETAQEFKDQTSIPTYEWDVRCFEETEKALEKIVAEVGPIDILVNNAGITRDTFFSKMTLSQWQDVIQTNLNSCFNVTRCVIQGMMDRGYGRIVMMSSVNAQKGQAGQSNYCASKAGMIGFTKALAQETASKGITVNAVAPGYTDTEMTRAIAPHILEKIVGTIPMKHLCAPEDIARAVSFLVSEHAGYITGTTLSVNGGLYYA